MKQNKILFISIVAIYIIGLLIFIGIILFEINKKVIVNSSSVPVLLEERINRIDKQLGERIKVEQPNQVDISNYNFGKDEPFN
jgi:hypothetical protein